MEHRELVPGHRVGGGPSGSGQGAPVPSKDVWTEWRLSSWARGGPRDRPGNGKGGEGHSCFLPTADSLPSRPHGQHVEAEH